MIAVRSVLFIVAVHVVTALFCLLGLPLLAMPSQVGRPVCRLWALSVSWLARVICNITFEVRGRRHLPHAAALVASKHQSAWETINLLHILPDPSFVLKKELTRIPLFGWYAIKFGHLPIDREGGGKALRRLVSQARTVAAQGRPIVIFPEGTRRAPGAPADYQRGLVALYRMLDVQCVPAALNSGVFWPRRGWRRRPGRIIIEFLPAIAPGLDGETFLADLKGRIEPASARLLDEARARSDS